MGDRRPLRRRRVSVFLSYRRSDVGGYAGRLADDLVATLGAAAVFHDVRAIPPGVDFVVEIERRLDSCDAVLAIIGPGWLTAAAADGSRRLDDADDVVRLELGTALRRSIPVVPVLVGGAELPAAGELPDELTELVRRQVVELRDESWGRDVESLVRGLTGDAEQPLLRRRAVTAALLAAPIVVLVGIVGLVWRSSRGGDDDVGEETVAVCATEIPTSWTTIPVVEGPPNGAETVDADGDRVVFSVAEAAYRPTGSTWEVLVHTVMAVVDSPSGSVYHYGGHYEALVVGRRPSRSTTCYAESNAGESPVPVGAVGDGWIGYRTECEPVGAMQLTVEGATFRFTEAVEPSACVP